MKKFKSILGVLSLSTLGILAACGSESEAENEPTNSNSNPATNQTSTGENNTQSNDNNNKSNTQNDNLSYDSTPTIFLAGDSTVKTYNDNQFIGGWGQYLDKFLDDMTKIGYDFNEIKNLINKEESQNGK